MIAACSHKPPANFAPDPGLLARIRRIEIRAPQVACPGQSFAVYYDAILDDGTRVPFENHYDRDRPPRLHVSFLDRSSWEARHLDDGGWTASADPLQTVRTGFRLVAAVHDRPLLTDTAVVAPEYSCLQHAFHFSGSSGSRGGAGSDGPAVTVRLGIVRSPFYERLLVAGIAVENAAPYYVLADANGIPPADWLTVESPGGRGGDGSRGRAGAAGVPGSDGCPGGPGGNGGNGGSGGAGAPGGRGGQITVISPTELPYLAGLVNGRSPGGSGGSGGKGGDGGKGGAGGHGTVDNRGAQCAGGASGQDGQDGVAGRDGPAGGPGPRPQIITVPLRDLFGPGLPPELAALLGRH